LYVKHLNDSDYTEYEPYNSVEDSLSQNLRGSTWVYFDNDMVYGKEL